MRILFSHILRASLSGSIVIAAVLILRLVLNRAPKRLLCLLWLLVGLRLILPISIQSSVSLQPQLSVPTQMSLTPAQASPIAPAVGLLPILWLAGVTILAAYGVSSWLRVRRRISHSVIFQEGVWIVTGLDTAFVFGLLRPQIYLPGNLHEADRAYVLAHERVHIAHGDHITRIVGFALLCVHWFNPLVWVAYHFLSRDLELACDEAVVKDLDISGRKSYSAALLRCSSQKRTFAACPVAFGEVSVKHRVLSVLHYRKPGFWICLCGAVALVFVAACFLTSPVPPEDGASDFTPGTTLCTLSGCTDASHHHETCQPTPDTTLPASGIYCDPASCTDPSHDHETCQSIPDATPPIYGIYCDPASCTDPGHDHDCDDTSSHWYDHHHR